MEYLEAYLHHKAISKSTIKPSQTVQEMLRKRRTMQNPAVAMTLLGSLVQGAASHCIHQHAVRIISKFGGSSIKARQQFLNTHQTEQRGTADKGYTRVKITTIWY